jgi:hypothetical protein
MVTWRQPAEPAPPKTLLAIAIAGAAGAIALPDKASGVGFLIVALVCAGSTFVVMGRLRPEPAAWGALALALVGTTVIRDAYWLFFLCLFAACIAGSLAVGGGKTVRGLALGAITVVAASMLAVPWMARGLATARRTASKKSVRVIQSVAVSAGLLVVFVPLLAGADAAFASILGSVTPTVDGGSLVRWILLFALVALGAAGACLAATAPPHLAEANRRRGRLARLEWALPVGILVVLFTAFAAVQFAGLFGGSEYVLRTAGMTYAVYARSGFWQLLAVTVLTLVVIAGAARWAEQNTAKDRAWLRALLGALSVLMLVVVASALTRMWLYQQMYGFTVQRLLVEACELWLGIVYLLVIASGIKLKNGWLPRAIVGSGLAGILVFAWINPERLVADHNVARWQQTTKIDVYYLSTLSADAAPALARLPITLRRCALANLERRLDDGDWRNWNLSRATARELRQEPPQQGCGAF